MKKSIRYSLYGFVTGVGVTILASLLMFVSLGVVGLSTPMVAVIAGILCPLGGGWGYRIGLNGACESTESGPFWQTRLGRLWLMPFVAFVYGALALTVLHLIVVERSFYFGLTALFATISILFYLTHINVPLLSEPRKLFSGYAFLGAGTSIIFGLLTWNLWPLIIGIVFTVACAVWVGRSPGSKISPDVLRPQEVQIGRYLNATLETMAESGYSQNVETARSATPLSSNRYRLWSIPAVLLACAILGYFIFPWTSNAAWKGIVGALLIGGGAFIFGMIIGRCGKSRNPHVQN